MDVFMSILDRMSRSSIEKNAPLQDDGVRTSCSVWDDYADPSTVAGTIAEKRSGARGQSGCQRGSWISKSSTGAGNRGGIEDYRGSEGHKTLFTSLIRGQFVTNLVVDEAIASRVLASG
jgi:hypothetical protein